ncbi:hypothetical protein MRB53_036275 [Persea americana]|nr:hypothetical protein MRB53_036453 [Persea americana]KAJ8614862.1 hypothetical protein MRB53_036275 [Persea americana]
MKTSSSQPRRKKKEEHGFDGALNERGTGIGIVLLSPEGVIIPKAYQKAFPATDVLGSWRTKEPRLMPYQALAERLVKEFEHVPREENGLADALATLASVVMCLSDQTRTGSQAHPGDKADKQPTFLPPVQMSRGRYLIQGGKFITDAPGTTSQLSAEFKHSRLGEEERDQKQDQSITTSNCYRNLPSWAFILGQHFDASLNSLIPIRIDILFCASLGDLSLIIRYYLSLDSTEDGYLPSPGAGGHFDAALFSSV